MFALTIDMTVSFCPDTGRGVKADTVSVSHSLAVYFVMFIIICILFLSVYVSTPLTACCHVLNNTLDKLSSFVQLMMLVFPNVLFEFTT